MEEGGREERGEEHEGGKGGREGGGSLREGEGEVMEGGREGD